MPAVRSSLVRVMRIQRSFRLLSIRFNLYDGSNTQIVSLVRTSPMMVDEEHVVSYRLDAVVALRSIWSFQLNADKTGGQVNFYRDRSSLKTLKNIFHRIHIQFLLRAYKDMSGANDSTSCAAARRGEQVSN